MEIKTTYEIFRYHTGTLRERDGFPNCKNIEKEIKSESQKWINLDDMNIEICNLRAEFAEIMSQKITKHAMLESFCEAIEKKLNNNDVKSSDNT